MKICPCGTGLDFDACCGPILGGVPAPTPEALMRARYSGFVTRNLDYVERTLAPEIRQDFNRPEAERTAEQVEWLGLDVLSASETGETGTVEFQFRFRRDGQEFGQHELAKFRRENGKWLYVSGKVGPKPPPRQVERIGRNDPCPCGSGKKFKKCCGA